MRQIADQYFGINKGLITLPKDPAWNNQMGPLEARKKREGEKFSIILQEEETKRENFTATYWG